MFSNRELDSTQRFAATSWTTLESGSPVLEQALVNFDCRIAQVHEVGSHSIFYCEVLHIKQGDTEEGLMYFNRAYHRLCESSKASF